MQWFYNNNNYYDYVIILVLVRCFQNGISINVNDREKERYIIATCTHFQVITRAHAQQKHACAHDL